MKLNEVLNSQGLMHHTVQITDVAERKPWLAEKCHGKSVMHVGCCDVPVFDPNNNLHIELSHATDRIDGLDISEDGIAVMKKHVVSDYYTAPDQIDKQYDIVLATEVLEHTPNPFDFLSGIFSIRASRYLITAPHIQWYEQSEREGNSYIEKVHGDHRAWYSPYTLVNTLRPFINATEDDIEVYLIAGIGSVAVEVIKNRTITSWQRQLTGISLEELDQPLSTANKWKLEGKTAEALQLLDRNCSDPPEANAYYLKSEILSSLDRHMDLFRCSVAFLRSHPNDQKCLLFAAKAAEGLGQHDQALQLRQMAQRT